MKRQPKKEDMQSLRISQAIDQRMLDVKHAGSVNDWIEYTKKKIRYNSEIQVHLGMGESYLISGSLLFIDEDESWFDEEAQCYKLTIKYLIKKSDLERAIKI